MTFRHYRRLAFTIMMAFAVLAACATPTKPEHKPEERVKAATPSLEELLKKAEAKAAKKDKRGELEIYRRIIREYPAQAGSDAAYYKIGLSHFNRREYKEALGNFEKVRELFTGSRYLLESRIKTGITLVYLKEDRKAETVLKNLLLKELTEGQSSTVLYHLGENRHLASEYIEALEWFVKCVKVKGAFRNQAQRRINRIIHNFLSEEELFSVADKYSGGFPADLALVELMQIYWRNDDKENLAKIAQRFGDEFPEMEKPEFFPEEPPVTIAPLEELTIGCILPLSGDDASLGAQLMKGIQLAFSIKSDVVAERKIRLVIKDSASDPGLARTALAELAEDETVIGVIGPFTPENLDAVLDVSRDNSLPLITPAESIAGRLSSYMQKLLFHTGMTGQSQGTMLAELAVSKLRYNRLAILYPDNDYGKELMQSFAAEAETLGAEIREIQSFHPDATDFAPQIKALGGIEDSALLRRVYGFVEKLREEILKDNPELALRMEQLEKDKEQSPKPSGEAKQHVVLLTPEEINERLETAYQEELTIPYVSKYKELPLTKDNFSVGLRINYDALFIPGGYKSAGLILPALVFYNVMGVQVIGSDLYATPELIKIGGKYSENVIFTGEFMPDLKESAVRNFVSSFENAFGETPDVNAARSYDTIMMVLGTIESGANTKESLAESLGSIEPFSGASGKMRIGSNGKMGKTPFLLTVTGKKITAFELPFYLFTEPEEIQ